MKFWVIGMQADAGGILGNIINVNQRLHVIDYVEAFQHMRSALRAWSRRKHAACITGTTMGAAVISVGVLGFWFKKVG